MLTIDSMLIICQIITSLKNNEMDWTVPNLFDIWTGLFHGLELEFSIWIGTSIKCTPSWRYSVADFLRITFPAWSLILFLMDTVSIQFTILRIVQYSGTMLSSALCTGSTLENALLLGTIIFSIIRINSSRCSNSNWVGLWIALWLF
jgi:hypothetical protein